MADVAVVGVPDDLWGELVVAVVVPTRPRSRCWTPTIDASALDRHARETLAGYKVPRRYVAVDGLPRNAYGKVVKRELRDAISSGELS